MVPIPRYRFQRTLLANLSLVAFSASYRHLFQYLTHLVSSFCDFLNVSLYLSSVLLNSIANRRYFGTFAGERCPSFEVDSEGFQFHGRSVQRQARNYTGSRSSNPFISLENSLVLAIAGWSVDGHVLCIPFNLIQDRVS